MLYEKKIKEKLSLPTQEEHVALLLVFSKSYGQMGNSGKKPIKTGHFVAQSLLQKWAIAHPGVGNRIRLWGIIPIQ